MHTIAIDTKVLIKEVPYLSMVENQRFTWDELGSALNLEVQGFGARASASGRGSDSSGFRTLPKQLWESVKAEVFALFCTKSRKYAAVRKRIKAHKEATTLFLLTTITAWLAGLIGVAPAMLTPLVATALFGIAQVGQNAWCEVMKARFKQ